MHAKRPSADVYGIGNGMRAKWLLGLGLMTGLAAAGGGIALGGCGTSPLSLFGDGQDPDDATAENGVCPPKKAAKNVLPGVKPEHRTLQYWLDRDSKAELTLMSAGDVAAHNAAFEARDRQQPDDDPLAHYDLLSPESPQRLTRDLRDRLSYMHERLADGRYLDAKGKKLSGDALRAFAVPVGGGSAAPKAKNTLHLAEADTPLRCGPRPAPLYKGPEVDPAFDRNSCSMIRKGELVRLISDGDGGAPDGMRLVRTTYAMGWIDAGAKLSSAIDKVKARQALPPPRTITRRALLEKAFSYLDTPYGWGGTEGGRDCSRFVMDTLGSFGLRLPRPSGLQAKAGTMGIDVSKLASNAEKLGTIDAAHTRGAVLLHFPGHIMLYLGRSAEGAPMAIHAFAEYAERCSAADAAASGRSETVRTVDRVQISDLSLGKGTSRKSFLERITRVTMLGGTPGQALLGAVERRPTAPATQRSEAADCPASASDIELLVTPRRPHPGVATRVIASSARDLGSTALAFVGPGGATHMPVVKTTGGPPFGYFAEIEAPEVGRWRVMLADGDRVEACRDFEVHERGDIRQSNNGRVWQPRKRWTNNMENLFATWIEQLFDYPMDDRTWPNLTALLAQRDNNLLHEYLGAGEEGRLALQPDCADLPYFLRAYFAWKMRLPFAYRHCNRGFEGKAPYCDHDTFDNLANVEASTEVKAFDEFARKNIANGVHSGSGRTGPDDDKTDYYPVPLTREAIRPGVIFADPYGHLFVIADWIPQGAGSYGVLIGADAQPDGTIGRRRFWPGSFLFTPETKEAGAGFKAFRPARYRGGRVRQYDNADIAGLGLTPFSMEQYSGDKASFYDRVEALINPRPLEPTAMMKVLAAALYEQVKRRVVSVKNGEEYKASHRGAIDMPSGHSIFETSGAWENYSTPSRDMRLLIAMDTVLGFPDAVKRNPSRFGVSQAAVDKRVADLRQVLENTLKSMDFAYVKSDGSDKKLTVKDVVDRATDFEMAYNPNDCVEIRWAAAEGGDERASCNRRAPAHQQAKMVRYRPWFAERRRPPR